MGHANRSDPPTNLLLTAPVIQIIKLRTTKQEPVDGQIHEVGPMPPSNGIICECQDVRVDAMNAKARKAG